MTDLSFTSSYIFIFVSCIIGFLFGIWNWMSVMSIDISKKPEGYGDRENFIPRNYEKYSENMEDISGKIQRVILNLI
jgi:hypothetical protein